MSYVINQSVISSKQVYFNSKHAYAFGGDPSYRSWGYFTFDTPIISLPSSYHVLLSVTTAEIPCSYYNINDKNNVFTFSVGANNFSITLPVGNYSAYDLANAIQYYGYAAPNSDSISNSFFKLLTNYDEISNRFIYYILCDVPMNASLTPAYTLPCYGLSGSSLTSSGKINKFVSDTSVDLAGPKAIFIRAQSMSLENYDSRTRGNSNILARIPTREQNNNIIYFTSDYKTKTFIKNLSNFEITLTDEDNEFINFNGVDWSMTLTIDIIQDMGEFKHDTSFMQE